MPALGMGGYYLILGKKSLAKFLGRKSNAGGRGEKIKNARGHFQNWGGKEQLLKQLIGKPIKVPTKQGDNPTEGKREELQFFLGALLKKSQRSWGRAINRKGEKA